MSTTAVLDEQPEALWAEEYRLRLLAKLSREAELLAAELRQSSPTSSTPVCNAGAVRRVYRHERADLDGTRPWPG